jgi:hypothetical protein
MSWWAKAFRARILGSKGILKSPHLTVSLTFPHSGNLREKMLEKIERGISSILLAHSTPLEKG